MYCKHNDNELIYLIKEGSPFAYSVLYEKYLPLMIKMIKTYKVAFYSYDDLLQEARMKFVEAIKLYNDYFNYSFYKYYCLLLSRMLSHHYKYNKFDSRYKPALILNDEIESLSEEKNEFLLKVTSLTRMLSFKDKITENLFYECIVEGFSLNGFCKKYSVEYYSIRVKYNNLINEIKKILTN